MLCRLVMAAIVLALPHMAEAQTLRGATQRENIIVVGSASMTGFVETIFKQIEMTRRIRAPEVRMTGNLRSAATFCEGIGPAFPDILALSRRMPKALFESCIDHGVFDVIEIKIGLSAVALATRKSDGQRGLTPNQVYRALAANVPDEKTEELSPNKAMSWKEISRELDDAPIRFVGSPQGTSVRDFFDDMVMQGGCRSEPLVQGIFQASLRVEKCTKARGDGVFIEVPDGQSRVAALMAAPPGTIGILSYGELVAGGNDLVAVALNGVLPTYQSISNDEYDYTRPLLFYVKRAHMVGEGASGTIKGLREFLQYATSEQVVGPGGILGELGLVSLPAALRVEQRRNAQILRRYEP